MLLVLVLMVLVLVLMVRVLVLVLVLMVITVRGTISDGIGPTRDVSTGFTKTGITDYS